MPEARRGIAMALLVVSSACGEARPPVEGPRAHNAVEQTSLDTSATSGSSESTGRRESSAPTDPTLPLEEWAAEATRRGEPFDVDLVRAVYAHPGACRFERDFTPDMTRPRVHPGEPTTFVWLFCDLGAYQVSGALFRTTGSVVTPVPLPYVGDGGQVAERSDTGFFDFDEGGGEATDFRKYRGLGDCGALARYRLGREGLTLIEYRERGCDDDFDGDEPPLAPTWPRLFPQPR